MVRTLFILKEVVEIYLGLLTCGWPTASGKVLALTPKLLRHEEVLKDWCLKGI